MRGIRIIVLCSAVVLVGAQEGAPPVAPTPIITLEISDVAALRARLAASWYGRLWAQPSAQPLRTLVSDGVARATSVTGITWQRIADQTTRVTLRLGGENSLALTLAEPAASNLVGAATMAQQEQERWMAHYAAVAVHPRSVPSQEVAPFPTAPGRVVAIQSTAVGFVLGRSPSYQPEFQPTDGWLVHAQGQLLSVSTPTTRASRATSSITAAPEGISLRVDLPAWAAGLGLPGTSEALRACGVRVVDGSVVIASEHSRETLRLPGAKLPLRPLDRALLERWIPNEAVAVSAVGLVGAELAALADMVAAERADLAPFIAVLRPGLHAMDGTAWIALVPSPTGVEFVAGIKASAELDRWLAELGPALSDQVIAGQWQPIGLSCAPLGDVTMQRTADCWIIASEASLLLPSGRGDFFRTRTGGVEIPFAAMAIGVQDNPALLRAFVRSAPLPSRMLREIPPDTEEAVSPIPRWMYHARTEIAALSEQIAALAAVAAVPVSVGYLAPLEDGVVVQGQDASAAWLAFPLMGVTATEVLPLLAPEWSRRHHPLFAVASAAEHVPWYEWTNGYAVSAGVRIPPWSQAQFNTIALASPFPAARGQALSLMQVTDDQAQADWAFTVCRGALRDSAVEVRDGAWRGLSAKRGHEAEVNALILAALRDADSDLRRRAAEQLDGSANIHRWKRDLVIGDGWEPSTPPLLPLEALALLLDLEQRESDPLILHAVLGALSGYDDPRILPRLTARLSDLHPRVRAGAAVAIGRCPAADGDPASAQALAHLLSDRAIGAAWGGSVGDAALEALAKLPGADIDTLFVAELAKPDVPSRDADFSPTRHVRVLQILLLRGHAPVIELIRHRVAQAFSPAEVRQLGWVLSRCPLTEAEDLLREWLGNAVGPQQNELLQHLSQCRSRRPLQPVTIAQVIVIITKATKEVNEEAVMLLREILSDKTQQPLVVPLVIPLLTSDQQIVRLAAREVVDDLLEKPQDHPVITQAIARAWKQFGAEAFPDYEQPPEPPPVPTNVKDF